MSIVCHLKMHSAHNPNYCSWLAVCANVYNKIALINRFKLYLIKKLTVRRQKNKKNKLNVNKNNLEYTLRLHLVNVT